MKYKLFVLVMRSQIIHYHLISHHHYHYCYYIYQLYNILNVGKIMDSFDTMKQAFKAVDKDCSGTVERGELDRVFESFGVGHSPADIDDLFAEYDKNGDGVFSYGEFVKIMSAKKK